MTITEKKTFLSAFDDQADPSAADSIKTASDKNINAEFSKEEEKKRYPNMDLVMNIPVDVQIVLGSTSMPVATLMNLGHGAVITLDKQIGDPVDIIVNGRVIARGEVIIVDDDSSRFGVTLTELLTK